MKKLSILEIQEGLLMACNTATAMALEIVKEELDIPVIGVILPGASSAIQKTKTNKIGVIATQASIRSDEYHKTIARKSSGLAPLRAPTSLSAAVCRRQDQGTRAHRG